MIGGGPEDTAGLARGLARARSGGPIVVEIVRRMEWTRGRTWHMRGIVAEGRRRHDEELLLYVEPEEVTDLLGGDEFGSN